MEVSAGQAYLGDLCFPTPGTRGLRSQLNGTGVLIVPVARISTGQTRAFSVVGLSVWNGHTLELQGSSGHIQSTPAGRIFLLAEQGSAALLSSNSERRLIYNFFK